MKKVLVVLLVLAMAFGAFAQINISGSVRAFGGYNSAELGGFYGMSEGFSISNNDSRIILEGNKDGKAGMFADLRFTTSSANVASFWGWAKPADWFKVNLGWFDIGDYLIKDGTETTKFGGNFRNSSKLDPLGGSVKFGVLGQFMVMDGNLNIGAAFVGENAVTNMNSNMSEAYIAAMLKLPNIGRAAIEGQMRTTKDNTADYARFTATFQYQSKMFDVGAGVKYMGKSLDAGKFIGGSFLSFDVSGTTYTAAYDEANFNILVLAGIRPVENLNIALGLEMFLMNGMGLADTISVSYNLGFIKPVLYAYGMTAFDISKAGGIALARVQPKKAFEADQKLLFQQVFGLELNIPVKVGTASFLAAGIAYDTAAEAFQVPVYFRLFF